MPPWWRPPPRAACTPRTPLRPEERCSSVRRRSAVAKSEPSSAANTARLAPTSKRSSASTCARCDVGARRKVACASESAAARKVRRGS
eukprot:scaffold72046_cov54-Phaeocystis_antarctica.AAC.2